MKFKVQDEIGAGSYEAVFSGTKQIETKFGQALLLIFRVGEQGPFFDTEVSALCNIDSITPRSKLGRFIAAMSGAPLVAGADIDTDVYRGQRGMIIVEVNDNGNANVTTWIPQQQSSPAEPQQPQDQSMINQ